MFKSVLKSIFNIISAAGLRKKKTEQFLGEFSLLCCTYMAHAGNTKIWAKIISAHAKKCSITGLSSLWGEKTQVYMPSRGMKKKQSDE